MKVKTKIKIKNQSIWYVLFSILLFLAFLNIKNYGNVIFLILFILMFFKTKPRICNKEECCLLLYGFLYVGIYIYNFGGSILSPAMFIYLLFPAMSYSLGQVITKMTIQLNINKYIPMCIVSMGLFMYGFLNMLSFGESSFITRSIKDYWTDTIIKATGQSMYYILIIGMLFFALFALHNSILKIVIVMMNVLVIYYSIQTSTRTPLFIMLISVSIGGIIYINCNKRKAKKILKWLGGIFLLIILIYFLYVIDIGEIQDWFAHSNLAQRMNTLSDSYKENDPRITAQIYVLKHLLDYPLGGCKLLLPMNEGTGTRMVYAHSLWFDTIYRVGIFPFFLLLIYTTLQIKKMIYIIKSSDIEDEMKYFLVPITIALLVQFAMEPIMEGMVWLFIAGCFCNGYMNQIIIQNEGKVDVGKYKTFDKNI